MKSTHTEIHTWADLFKLDLPKITGQKVPCLVQGAMVLWHPIQGPGVVLFLLCCCNGINYVKSQPTEVNGYLAICSMSVTSVSQVMQYPWYSDTNVTMQVFDPVAKKKQTNSNCSSQPRQIKNWRRRSCSRYFFLFLQSVLDTHRISILVNQL